MLVMLHSQPSNFLVALVVVAVDILSIFIFHDRTHRGLDRRSSLAVVVIACPK